MFCCIHCLLGQQQHAHGPCIILISCSYKKLSCRYITGLDVEQLRWSRPERYRHAAAVLCQMASAYYIRCKNLITPQALLLEMGCSWSCKLSGHAKPAALRPKPMVTRVGEWFFLESFCAEVNADLEKTLSGSGNVIRVQEWMSAAA